MLWRRNRDMAITVRADVVDGARRFRDPGHHPLLKEIEATLPSGYRLTSAARGRGEQQGQRGADRRGPVMLITILLI